MRGRSVAASATLALIVGCAVTAPPHPVADAPTPSVDAAPSSADTERPSTDAAPASPPPGLAALPDPEVRPLVKSERGNKRYVVWGKHYDVLESAAGYRTEGLASWYGTKFDGRLTSSGEVYDMYKLTAAHRSLPIPTYVRVVNLDNGKRSIVRVNDRGPFHDERIIDLSYAAAVKLGFVHRGTARVRVEAVLPAPPATGAEDAPGTAPYYIRAGRFQDLDNADAARDALAPVVPGDTFVVRAGDAFALRIGPLGTRHEADRLRAFLAFQEHAPVIVEE